VFDYTLNSEPQFNLTTELKNEIEKIDEEIDQMVYELYGLTEEEITIVKNSTN